MAVPPPTLALAPGIACTVVLIRSTSAYAAGLSGGVVIVACTKDRPFLVTGGATDAMAGGAASAVLTCPAPAAGAITFTGSPEPAGGGGAQAPSGGGGTRGGGDRERRGTRPA